MVESSPYVLGAQVTAERKRLPNTAAGPNGRPLTPRPGGCPAPLASGWCLVAERLGLI